MNPNLIDNNNVVESLQEAREWFLSHASGTVIAHHPNMGDKIRVCETYDMAREYFDVAFSQRP